MATIASSGSESSDSTDSLQPGELVLWHVLRFYQACFSLALQALAVRLFSGFVSA
jgi:hypothetical protein